MIFEANIDQIKALESHQLVNLMRRLMLAECRLAGIPLRNATIPLQITVPDGGEDGNVEWQDGVDYTDFFPSRCSIFQSKAQNLTESTVRNEIVTKQRNSASRLNNAISEAIRKQGAYIIFSSHAFNGKKIKKLKNAIISTIEEYNQNPDGIKIEIYDANKIASWVNTHHSVALWLASLQRGRSVYGFQSHESWGKTPEIANIHWVSGNDLRFSCKNEAVSQNERIDKNFNGWDFKGVVEKCYSHLDNEQNILRISGPSGFGKTRLVFELFNQDILSSSEIEKNNVVYADFDEVGDEVFKLAREAADTASPTMLVVDECSDENHNKLVSIVMRVGSRMRLVTINAESTIGLAKNHLLVHIEPAPDELIKEISKAISPKINDADIRVIQEIAKGFPKMAILAAQNDAVGGHAISSAAGFIERIVWGSKQKSDQAQKSLEILSLFEWVGVAGHAEEEAAFIAEKLVGISKDTFVEHIKSFTKRGIIITRGNYLQVVPVPLAANLAATRLSLLPNNKICEFFNDAPINLQYSLLKRMRWLDNTPQAKEFAKNLCQQNCLGNLSTLNTEFGSKCIDLLVHIEPDVVMTTIQNILGELDNQELKNIYDGRRYLIWALEKLAFRKESFEKAATLLRRLSAAEIEDGISNNASGQFKQLYQLQLSGTEADPDKRLIVLDEGLKSSDEAERLICVEALSKMLDMGHFSRSGGAEEIGSNERLEDWRPKTWDEVRDYNRAAISRLFDIANSADKLSEKATNIICSHIRGLLNLLPLNEIKDTIQKITSCHGLQYKAISGVNSWLYYDSKGVPKDIVKSIRQYFDELMPSDPVELAIIYTRGWHADFHDPDTNFAREEKSGQHDFYYSSRKAVELADIIASEPKKVECAINALVCGEANNVFPFSKRLAELVVDPTKLFYEAVAIIEARPDPVNLGFFNGFIAGIDNLSPEIARECIGAALKSDRLKQYAISMIGSGKLQGKDISLVIKLIQSGDIQPSQCVTLSYGQCMGHLAPSEIIPLIDELKTKGTDGLWSALEIISMLLHSNKEILLNFSESIIDILTSPELFSKYRNNNMDGHNLEQSINRLIKGGYINKQIARMLVKQLLSICDKEKSASFCRVESDIRKCLLSIAKIHPEEVWVEISTLFLSGNSVLKFMLQNLLRMHHRNNLEAGLLFELPSELYLHWVRNSPDNRASIVVDWLPIAIKGEDESLSWHPFLESFVSEFGNKKDVLLEISSRFQPTFWGGSLVPYFEPILPLLDSWSNHKHAEVRKWVAEQKNIIKSKIDKEKYKDEEEIIRYG